MCIKYAKTWSYHSWNGRHIFVVRLLTFGRFHQTDNERHYTANLNIQHIRTVIRRHHHHHHQMCLINSTACLGRPVKTLTVIHHNSSLYSTPKCSLNVTGRSTDLSMCNSRVTINNVLKIKHCLTRSSFNNNIFICIRRFRINSTIIETNKRRRNIHIAKIANVRKHFKLMNYNDNSLKL